MKIVVIRCSKLCNIDNLNGLKLELNEDVVELVDGMELVPNAGVEINQMHALVPTNLGFEFQEIEYQGVILQ